ncbi:hypothetical protein U0070_001073 [Myodes glareolus]|uniref:Uncharacterized protein n=1 Tax=Myodes glareolus TaxID=447135 RepID=A0AAW0IWG0_MYOGA
MATGSLIGREHHCYRAHTLTGIIEVKRVTMRPEAGGGCSLCGPVDHVYREAIWDLGPQNGPVHRRGGVSNPENSATRSAIQQQLPLAFMTLEAIKLTVGDPDTEGPWMWGADGAVYVFSLTFQIEAFDLAKVIQGYFPPPPPLSPELSFQVQGLRDTSSLPLSRREGGQGSGGQVLTVTLLDKVGQAFSSKALEQRLISSGVNCFLPERPLILPAVRSLRLSLPRPTRTNKVNASPQCQAGVKSSRHNVFAKTNEDVEFFLNSILLVKECAVRQSLIVDLALSDWPQQFLMTRSPFKTNPLGSYNGTFVIDRIRAPEVIMEVLLNTFSNLLTETLEMLGSKNRSSIFGHSSQAWLCITRTQRPCESTSGQRHTELDSVVLTWPLIPCISSEFPKGQPWSTSPGEKKPLHICCSRSRDSPLRVNTFHLCRFLCPEHSPNDELMVADGYAWTAGHWCGATRYQGHEGKQEDCQDLSSAPPADASFPAPEPMELLETPYKSHLLYHDLRPPGGSFHFMIILKILAVALNPFGSRPLRGSNGLVTGVMYQITCTSNIYIMIYNSSKITVTKKFCFSVWKEVNNEECGIRRLGKSNQSDEELAACNT